MRLIDADKLIDVFSEKKEVWRGNGVLPSNESLMWLAAMDITANAPTIDAAPVKHGRWGKVNNPRYSPFDGSPEHLSICSNCAYSIEQHDFLYCPNCGAKMDLEE